MNNSQVQTDKEEARALVGRHQVCYEVSPEWAFPEGVQTHIGYELRLCGVNDGEGLCAGEHPTPGCPHCLRTFERLGQIAARVLPKSERASRYEVQPFDRSWHVAPKERGSRNEVVLAVKILHRRDVNAPADGCELKCLKEMRAGLKGLGVGEGKYREAGAGAAGVTAR